MKKFQIALLILVVAGLFTFADYSYNLPGGIPDIKPSLPGAQDEYPEQDMPDLVSHPNVTKNFLETLGLQSSYKIERRFRSTELFEKFDFSQMTNLSIYKNVLVGQAQGQDPIYIYEIHGPTGQTSLTYLNTKLAMLDQLELSSDINEANSLGKNSLFYNNEADPSTGFLLVEVDDIAFGFKYNKNQQEAFDFIKNLINNYTPQS